LEKGIGILQPGAYLRRETLNENGDQKIKENVIAKGHQRYEIKSGPVRCLLHTIEENNVPVFLREDLYKKKNGKRLPLHTHRYLHLFNKACDWQDVFLFSRTA
jgi:hypothetical protein